ncbi:MAG: BamA/TamA family outer membrane protein [Bacteroidaceae bacterium]|nr:BamA/TamA family outer membrane protein [Bacteroidaceae bacterium]
MVVAVWALASCSTSKYVPEGAYLLHSVGVHSDSKAVSGAALQPYVQTKPNARWFSLVRVPLAIYSLSGRDTTRWINRTLRRLGEPPVLYDSVRTRQTADILRSALNNRGYMQAQVDIDVTKKGRRANVEYHLHPGRQYVIGQMRYVIGDDSISALLNREHVLEKGLEVGEPLTVSRLESERKRITAFLQDRGYYHFHQEYIVYDADSVVGSPDVMLTLHLLPYQASGEETPLPHSRYTIGKVEHVSQTSEHIHLRPHVIDDNTLIEPGQWYSNSAQQKTYSRFGRLPNVKYTGISYTERPDTTVLDATIQIETHKPNSISFQPEGTNTAGDLGAAATLTYENRNLFRGGERLGISLRGAFEAITGLEGYKNEDYEEYGAELTLTFPRLVVPFLSRHTRQHTNGTSTVAVNINMQQRPEFHRRVAAAAWRYRWTNEAHPITYRVDLLDLNYIYMPSISETFRRNYLDSVSSRNVVLRYNYEDLFIMKTGFGFTYSTPRNVLRFNIETAGNLLSLGSHLFRREKNKQGQYAVFNIAFAQYAKTDIDYSHIVRFDANNTLVLHAALGLAWPYGNSRVLPFEKRYFSGGANSVRGWGVRRLGPGIFHGKDGRIDFINQTGDIKIDLNVEYRTRLFWKLHGAAFIDAGNIWTWHHYDEQEGGQFRLSEFYRQLAAAYGIGFRLHFDYFILRFDLGMKAVNPVYNTQREHFPLLHPRLSRDFHFHFAVGLPF